MSGLASIARRVLAEEAKRPVTEMTFSEFARSGRYIRIYSEALGRRFILAADDVDEAELVATGLVFYRAREFRHILGVDEEQIRLIHRCKEEFGGELV